MWDSLVGFLASIIDMFFRLTGNFGVAVILFTILVKGLLLPLDIKSKKSTAKIQEIQPQINLINEKYANDPEKKSKKMQEVYAANHINPLGGCLPMLLTMPVIIIIFAALRRIAADHMYLYLETLIINNNAGMREIIDNIIVAVQGSEEFAKITFRDILPQIFNNSGELTAAVEKLPEVIGAESWAALQTAIKGVSYQQAQATAQEMGYSFLWIKNIWAPDSPLKSILGTSFAIKDLFGENAGQYWSLCNGFFVLPIISTVSQFYHTHLMEKKNKKAQDEAAAKMKKKPSDNAQDPQNTMKVMNKIFPLMSLYFCATYNGAFAVYWTISNFVSIGQMFITDYILTRKKSVKE